MLTFALIGLLFVLVGIAGLQFTYLFYFDRIDHERKRHIHELERRSQKLVKKLDIAERRVEEQNKMLSELGVESEVWADVIEDR